MPHIHEQIDYTVEVYVVYKDKVLLRKHDKYNIWLGVGGHIELNEDPNEAAVREVKEEVGLDITLFDNRIFTDTSDNELELIPPFFVNRHHINKTHEHISLIYFAASKSNHVSNVSDEISDELRWFSKNEILGNDEIKNRIKQYALKALETVN